MNTSCRLSASLLDKWPVRGVAVIYLSSPSAPTRPSLTPPNPPPVSVIFPPLFFSCCHPSVSIRLALLCLPSTPPLPPPPQLIESCLPQTALISTPRGLSGEGRGWGSSSVWLLSSLGFRRVLIATWASVPSLHSLRLTSSPVPSVTYHLQKQKTLVSLQVS